MKDRHHFVSFPVSLGVLAILMTNVMGCGGTDRKTYTAATEAPATSRAGPAVIVGAPSPVASSTTASSATSAQTPPVVAGAPRYPIVLLHGIGGFAKLGPLDGFFEVPGHLQSLGVQVLAPQVAALGTIEQRAEQLRDQILAAFPDPAVKVNIVAHSMGGLDARAAIARYGLGDKVVSLTTISTPHQGSPVADAAVDGLPRATQRAVDDLLAQVQWSWDSVIDLTTEQVQGVFNPSTPDDPRVYYQSYGCEADPTAVSGTRIQPLLVAPWAIANAAAGPNDGLVPLSSARWGEWKGALPTDHLGVIGFNPGGTPFGHKAFYAQLAADLAARGY